jgi:glycine/D-amino acid oxidase-like deaminating enzyme
MDRRTLLQLFAGVAVSGVPSFGFQTPRPKQIVIAGGGILGANIAYRLAKRGASVTVLERTKPATGATANSFAWVNAKKQPFDYFSLNRLGIDTWRQLDRELNGELPIVWGGSVEWTSDAQRGARMLEAVRRFQTWGYPIQPIDEAALHRLERQLTIGPVAAADYAESEAHIDPVGCTDIIMARAAKEGARVQYPCEVTGLDVSGGQLRAVRTTTGDVPADVLVIACGVDTPKLAAMVGLNVPLTRSPGILVHTPPRPLLVNRVVMSPIGNIKQKPDGRIVTGVDFGPAKSEDTSTESGQQFLERMAAVAPQLRDATVEKVTLGFRPMPLDGHPIIGFTAGRRDVYITVMHSGVTLSPLVGRLAAAEILDGVQVDLLSPYRLERFKG